MRNRFRIRLASLAHLVAIVTWLGSAGWPEVSGFSFCRDARGPVVLDLQDKACVPKAGLLSAVTDASQLLPKIRTTAATKTRSFLISSSDLPAGAAVGVPDWSLHPAVRSSSGHSAAVLGLVVSGKTDLPPPLL